MEAKKRGAKVIHVDPRFTRTSALADAFVPIRAGSDIAFLGGVVNYILDNELDFREYVLAYTNAATIVSEDFRDTEDLDGLFSGFDPETAHLRPGVSWQYAGPRGRRRPAATRRRERETARRAAARVARRAGAPADTERDETLQHPRCVYQILKRHFARYTPEMVERVCGVPPEQFREVCEAWTAQLRPRAHHRAGLLGRLDPAQRRRAVHPHRRDHPAAAGQHGPPRRRRHGAARARQHPGLHRHPDAVQPAARLPADAAPRAARDVRRVGRQHPAPRPEGLLGQRRRVRGQPAQGVLGRRGDRRTTTTATATCPG